MSNDITLNDQLSRLAEIKADMFKRRIDELAIVYGSIRAVGRALNLDPAYLVKLSNGEKTNPSKATLRKLGL